MGRKTQRTNPNPFDSAGAATSGITISTTRAAALRGPRAGLKRTKITGPSHLMQGRAPLSGNSLEA